MTPLHDWQFWAAVAGASIFRAASSPKPIGLVLLGVGGGIFCALVFTDATLDWLNADPAKYKVALAAILTLTGESLLRLAVSIPYEWSKVIDLMKQWKQK